MSLSTVSLPPVSSLSVSGAGAGAGPAEHIHPIAPPQTSPVNLELAAGPGDNSGSVTPTSEINEITNR